MRISKKLFIMLATASLLGPPGAGADEIPHLKRHSSWQFRY